METKKPTPKQIKTQPQSSTLFKKIIIVVLCLVGILGIIIIFFLKQSLPSTDKLTGNQIITTPTPGPFEITNGSIYKNTNGNKELVIDKFSVKNPKWPSDIVEITSMTPSPDLSKLLFRTYEGAKNDLLYYSDSAGTNITFIDPATEAVWSPTGRFIAYTNSTGEVGPLNVFVYDIKTQKQLTVTQESRNVCPAGYSIYTNISWLQDESGINAHFEQHKCPPPLGDKTAVGETVLHFAKE